MQWIEQRYKTNFNAKSLKDSWQMGKLKTRDEVHTLYDWLKKQNVIEGTSGQVWPQNDYWMPGDNAHQSFYNEYIDIDDQNGYIGVPHGDYGAHYYHHRPYLHHETNTYDSGGYTSEQILAMFIPALLVGLCICVVVGCLCLAVGSLGAWFISKGKNQSKSRYKSLSSRDRDRVDHYNEVFYNLFFLSYHYRVLSKNNYRHKKIICFL